MGKSSLLKALTLICCLAAATACQSGKTHKAVELSNKSSSAFILKGVTGVTQISQITGAESPNKTNNYGLMGTDLGSMINLGEKTFFVFGDSFGAREEGMTGGGGEDWRSNTLAYSSDTDPSDGITLDGMIEDEAGHAKELLPSLKIDNEEMTKIPTHGIAVGNKMYLYYMSVKHWGAAGQWEANYSSLARSNDEGKSWDLLDNVKWPGESSFIQVSPFKVKVTDELTEIYFWTIPAGRFDNVRLMKVDEKQIEDIAQYRYYAGLDAKGEPIWSEDLEKAAAVVEDTAGELSVIWNPYLNRWIMMYLKEGTGVVIREGLTPWGPWGKSQLVADKDQFPGLYAPFMNARFMENDGKTIYFSLSRWDPYNVFWMKAELIK